MRCVKRIPVLSSRRAHGGGVGVGRPAAAAAWSRVPLCPSAACGAGAVLEPTRTWRPRPVRATRSCTIFLVRNASCRCDCGRVVRLAQDGELARLRRLLCGGAPAGARGGARGRHARNGRRGRRGRSERRRVAADGVAPLRARARRRKRTATTARSPPANGLAVIGLATNGSRACPTGRHVLDDFRGEAEGVHTAGPVATAAHGGLSRGRLATREGVGRSNTAFFQPYKASAAPAAPPLALTLRFGVGGALQRAAARGRGARRG